MDELRLKDCYRAINSQNVRPDWMDTETSAENNGQNKITQRNKTIYKLISIYRFELKCLACKTSLPT